MKGLGAQMRKSAIALMVLMAVALTGCGGGDTAESVAKDMLTNLKEMGAILTSVTDEASAEAAVPKIEALRASMRDCAARAKKVPKIDAAQEAKIDQMMQAGMMEAMQSIGTAQERLASKPELMAIIQPAMEGMDSDL